KMTIDTKKRSVELLAPVGGIEHLRAAVEAGADAVYLGGKLFNARINANNFDDEEMRYAVDYAHLRGVKVFVTMNTLLRDEELGPALSYARELYEIGVDALIVQDLGLAGLLRKTMPDFPLHLSTQGTVYDADGVRAAAKLGFERVVLARELTLSEIEACCSVVGPSGRKTEIEVFVHGALCVCYSGQCNMSRYFGGRSGNRGLCAQPCRLAYTGSGGVSRHFLSPKDSCALDLLGELIEAGVKSFKIEGRMKSPEYVAIVTGIYRKYIDMYISEGFVKVEDADRRALLQAFNRGGFTDGYLTGKVGSGMMAMDVPKHQGTYIGKVIGTVKRGRQSSLVRIELAKGAHLGLGDGVEIHTKEFCGNVVTYIEGQESHSLKDVRLAKDAINAKEGYAGPCTLIIGDIEGEIKGGEEIWKITDKALNESMESLYKGGRDGNDVGQRRLPIELEAHLHVGKPAEFIAGAALDLPFKGDETQPSSDITYVGSIETFTDIVPEKPLRRAMDHGRIIEQLSKCGDFPFAVADFVLDADEELAIPVSSLNRMRRSAMEKLAETIKAAYRRDVESIRNELDKSCYCKDGTEFDRREFIHAYRVAPDGKYDFSNTMIIGGNTANMSSNDKMRSVETPKSEGGLEKESERLLLIPAEEFKSETIKRLLPSGESATQGASAGQDAQAGSGTAVYLSRVSKGRLNEWIDSHIEELREAAELTGNPIFVGNLGQLIRLRDVGIPVAADYGLNATNHAALKVLRELGAETVVEALEFREDVSGALPLMITEQPLDAAGESLQGKSRKECGEAPMRVIHSPLGDKTYIIAH
ncbi:MAG: U32 family peptidase, partial [Firmicutes bacterium]|nr:U32 family peptidase [Bacillota bacterium]